MGFGQQTCKAVKPLCVSCANRPVCPYYGAVVEGRTKTGVVGRKKGRGKKEVGEKDGVGSEDGVGGMVGLERKVRRGKKMVMDEEGSKGEKVVVGGRWEGVGGNKMLKVINRGKKEK